MEIKRETGESYISFAQRVTNAVEDGLIGYDEWSTALLGAVRYNTENLRRCYQFASQLLQNAENDDIEQVDDKDKLAEIRAAIDELDKSRLKLRTENLEWAANRRADARLEMFGEEIEAAINRLEPIKFSRVFDAKQINERTGVLCIGDEHYGTIIDMESLFGEKVNVYSPDIFKSRMNMLMRKMVDDKYNIADYDNLVVFDMGDAIQGMLRQSDLVKLKAGVIDSAMQYAEYISNWLVELSEQLEVPVEYICLGGNHCELRLLNGRKGDFPQENIGRIIREFVALRLRDNPNVVVAPYAECGFKTIQGVNILAYHGDDAKSDLGELNFWQDYHGIDIDLLLMGHFHHLDNKTVGVGLNTEKEVIRCPSIVGVDDFSKRCRKMSRAGAIFMMFEDGEKTWQRKYVLN